MRRFVLDRKEDETGISGIGIVAEGVQFTSGRCSLTWLTPYSSVAVYDSIEDVEAIHGHNGKTIIVWIDEPDTRKSVIIIDHGITAQQLEDAIDRVRKILGGGSIMEIRLPI